MIPKIVLARKDWTDYEAILSELEPILKLGAAELMDHYRHHPQDAACDLPKPGGGQIPFTLEGERRFEQIAIRGLEAMGSEGRRHHLPEVLEALKAEFISWQIGNFVLSADSAHDLVDGAIASLARQQITLTHYLPCSLVVHREPSRFQIGPVKFTLCSLFLAENEGAIRQSESGFAPMNIGYEEVAKFFSKFYWVASVEVAASASPVSEKRARRIVQMALDLFKLCIGSGRAADVRQGYDYGQPNETATLVSRAPAKFGLSWRRKVLDAVVMDNWYQSVSQFPAWRSAEVVIEEYAKTWDDLPEPYERFLDGLAWHGEAVSDPEPQSRLVKFWIAIERVVSLRANDNITRRAAVLTSRDRSGFVEQSKKVDRLHGKRSSVIHGSAGRSKKEFALHAAATEELSRGVIGSYLFLLEKLRRAGTVSSAALKNEFERLQTLFSPSLDVPD